MKANKNLLSPFVDGIFAVEPNDDMRDKAELLYKDFFEGDFDLVEFENHLVYDKDAFISRNLSSSYAPKVTDDCYDEYVKAISEVFDKHSNNGKVSYPYITRCYIGKVI